MTLANQAWLLKGLFLLVAYLLHGRPFIGPFDYAYALLVVYLLIWGIPRQRIHLPFLTLGMVFLICWQLIPQLAIPEYQRILMDDQNNILSPDEFIRNPSQFPFFLTADGYVQGKNKMRMVPTIDIDKDIQSLRSGWINRSDYNFYEKVSPLVRAELPFVVCYKITPSLIGATLQLQGTVMTERHGQFTPLNPEIKQIVINDQSVGSTVCGFGGKWNKSDSQPLKMSLIKNFKHKLFGAFRILSLFMGIGFFYFGLFSIPLTRRLSLQTALLCLSAISFFIYFFQELKWGIVAAGGGDGMIHDGYAQVMLEHWAAGDWKEALMSPEHVFYFMPGMRYVRFLEMLMFGDSYSLQATLCIFIPVIFYRLFLIFLRPPVALFLSLISFANLLNGFGLSYKLYTKSFLNLYGEGFSYALLLIGIILLSKPIKNVSQGFLIFFLFAISLSIRPNLAIFIGILCGIHLFTNVFSSFSWPHRFLMLFGLSPVLLIPIHNIIGGEIVLITKASQIPENLNLTPKIYYQAACYWLGLSESCDHLGQLSNHFHKMHLHYILAWCICLWVALKNQVPFVRAIAAATFGGLCVHLFYMPEIRYLHPYMTITIALGLSLIPKFRGQLYSNKIRKMDQYA